MEVEVTTGWWASVLRSQNLVFHFPDMQTLTMKDSNRDAGHGHQDVTAQGADGKGYRV